MPKERRAATVLELVPEGTFLTYGIGTSLIEMRHPETALAHVPVASRIGSEDRGFGSFLAR